MTGKFIVLEGIDGAGCGTQTEILKEKLNPKLLQPVLHLRYPDYNNPIGVMIHEFLHGRIEINPKIQFLLYALDMLKDTEKIKDALQKNRVVLADRYFTTTINYQVVQGFPLKKALNFAEMFGVIKPGLVIYLKVSPETSMSRKREEKMDLDMFERDMDLRKKVSDQYNLLAKNNIFGKWIIVDDEKPIEEVADEIFKIVKEELKIE